MKRNVLSFQDFCKNNPPHHEEKGEHEVVKAHYDEKKDPKLSEQDPKHPAVKGSGEADHTEEVKANDLSDPKMQPKDI